MSLSNKTDKKNSQSRQIGAKPTKALKKNEEINGVMKCRVVVTLKSSADGRQDRKSGGRKNVGDAKGGGCKLTGDG